MKCLIIAAGRGSRLNALAESKPLVPIDGVPLIERIIRRAAAAGAREFVVVTGYRATQVEDFLDGLAAATGLSVQTVRNPDCDRPNGLSVLAAAEALDGEFLLLMADHLFAPAIVEKLVAVRIAAADLILAVDYNVESPLLDLDDATKVQIGGGGEIVRIGKTLSRYDAIDAGAFRTGPALLAAIRRSLAEGGQGSLSEGVQALADRGRAWTLDIGNSWWIDVDDPRAFHLAERQLRAGRIGIRDTSS